MSSWRDEIPSDLPRQQMLAEAVERGTARRRRRQRREAALGGGLGLLVIVVVAVAAMSLASPGTSTNRSDVNQTGLAGADSSAGSTQQPRSSSPESRTGTAPAPGAPEFVAASGNAGTQRVIMRFTLPVVAGASELAPTYFVLHQAGDSTCSSPTGNGSEYLGGLGTTTITIDAPNLVIGTTYISIARGFVRSAQDGTESAPVGCAGILVKG